MILTKAYITQLPANDSNYFRVRVPLMEDNTGTTAEFNALLCSDPALYNGYSEGDCVYVHFEDDVYNECVILGKLFTGVPEDSRSFILTNDLIATGTVVLPKNTKFGDVSANDISNLYNYSGAGGGGGGDDCVVYDPTKYETGKVYAKTLKVCTGEEYLELKQGKKKNVLYLLTSAPPGETIEETSNATSE